MNNFEWNPKRRDPNCFSVSFINYTNTQKPVLLIIFIQNISIKWKTTLMVMIIEMKSNSNITFLTALSLETNKRVVIFG